MRIMEQNKKYLSTPGLIILILSLLLVGIGGFLLYDYKVTQIEEKYIPKPVTTIANASNVAMLTFKINFDKPIAPHEEFDISYSITIPNELSVYDKKKEIQSISLVRIKHPVDKLVFNICLYKLILGIFIISSSSL